MDPIYQILGRPCLIMCILLLEIGNIHCCLPEPKNTGSSRKFIFQALPSTNISLGDKLEIRCTANDTSDLSTVEIWSRMRKNLNVTCSVRSTSGFCSLLINKVQLWDMGIYDCIKKYKNGGCFSKALTIQKAIQIPIENSTVATTSTLSTTNTTRKPWKSTTNSLKPQGTTSETREEATSEIIKNVTNNEDKPTSGGGAICLKTQGLRIVILTILAVICAL